MRPTTTLTLSDLPRTIRGRHRWRPLVSVAASVPWMVGPRRLHSSDRQNVVYAAAVSVSMPTFRFLPVIGRRAPVTTPQVTGPGRASPVPAATLDTFRAPYAGESLTAALPGSSPLPWPSPRFREARHSLARPEGRLSNDAAGFASCYGPHRRSPFTGPLPLGSNPARFQTRPPACYRAPWQLPGPDFHRQATSLRTRRSTVALHVTVSPPFCWAHGKGSAKVGSAPSNEPTAGTAPA
jgi:hypothetical protein